MSDYKQNLSKEMEHRCPYYPNCLFGCRTKASHRGRYAAICKHLRVSGETSIKSGKVTKRVRSPKINYVALEDIIREDLEKNSGVFSFTDMILNPIE